MSLTDAIYRELAEGLKTGLDYDSVRLKHDSSKGPFYTAVQRVLAHGGEEMGQLASELAALQRKTTEAEAHLAELRDLQRQAGDEAEARKREGELLEKKEAAIKGRLDELEGQLTARAELLEQLGQTERTGFGMGELRRLHDTLAEIGSKQGLKPKEAVDRFFIDMNDYDAKVGFEREARRLQTVAETQKLEAEKWQAEKEGLERTYKGAAEAISAMESLLKQGVKTEHIVSWNKALSGVGGVDELEKELRRHGSVRQAVAAEQKEVERLKLRKKELDGEIASLTEQRAEVEGGIRALSAHGSKELSEVKNRAVLDISSLVDEFGNQARELAELKAKAAKLEKEMGYARYLAADDDTVKSAPRQIVILLLETVVRHFELNGLDPQVGVPAFMKERLHWALLSYDRVGLLELIRWLRMGIIENDELLWFKPTGGGTNPSSFGFYPRWP